MHKMKVLLFRRRFYNQLAQLNVIRFCLPMLDCNKPLNLSLQDRGDEIVDEQIATAFHSHSIIGRVR